MFSHLPLHEADDEDDDGNDHAQRHDTAGKSIPTRIWESKTNARYNRNKKAEPGSCHIRKNVVISVNIG